MLKRRANGKSGVWQKMVSALLVAVMLPILPVCGSISVLAAEVQSYTITIDELQTTKLEELPEYGAVKTADGKTSTVMWMAVFLLGTGWILDRRYLSEWEEKHDGRKETTKKPTV